jgi:hypothetical protein
VLIDTAVAGDADLASPAADLIESGVTTQPVDTVIAVLAANRDGASINAAAKASGINYRTAADRGGCGRTPAPTARGGRLTVTPPSIRRAPPVWCAWSAHGWAHILVRWTFPSPTGSYSLQTTDPARARASASPNRRGISLLASAW